MKLAVFRSQIEIVILHPSHNPFSCNSRIFATYGIVGAFVIGIVVVGIWNNLKRKGLDRNYSLKDKMNLTEPAKLDRHLRFLWPTDLAPLRRRFRRERAGAGERAGLIVGPGVGAVVATGAGT